MRHIDWAFGAATLHLVAADDQPVRLAGVGLEPPAGGVPVPLVEIALNREGRTGRSPNAQNRQYAASSRLRLVEAVETDETEQPAEAGKDGAKDGRTAGSVG